MEKGDLIAVRGTPAARVGKSDHMLTVPPWRTFTLLQLVDVQDTNLQRLLKRTKATATCDPKTGYSCILFVSCLINFSHLFWKNNNHSFKKCYRWIHADTWQRVKKSMEERLRQVFDGAVRPLCVLTPPYMCLLYDICLIHPPTHTHTHTHIFLIYMYRLLIYYIHIHIDV